MTRKAVVRPDGLVENVIEAGEDFTLDGRSLVDSDTASPGDTWDGSQFITPPQVASPPTADEELDTELDLATTVAALKKALHGRVKSR
jgi:hypothetical protein